MVGDECLVLVGGVDGWVGDDGSCLVEVIDFECCCAVFHAVVLGVWFVVAGDECGGAGDDV